MSKEFLRDDLPEKPSYARLLLARGVIGYENPIIYSVNYFSVFEPNRDPPRRSRWTWHWRTPRGILSGLSVVIRYSNEATLRREWRELASLCKLDRDLFDSMFIKRVFVEHGLTKPWDDAKRWL